MRNFIITFFIWILCVGILFAQTSKEEVFEQIDKAGGVYYAYPVKEIGSQTAVPKGYKPFYISHFARHGSRYLINDVDYKWVLDLFEDAGKHQALTSLGEEVHRRLVKVWEEADGRGGDLSPLGVRQHRGIAERIYACFPEVFAGNGSVSARSTVVTRCVLSMVAFCERLKEQNPRLKVSQEASNKYMRYLNFHTKQAIDFRSSDHTWKEQYRKFEESHTRPQRLISALFSDKSYINKNVNPASVMWGLYWISSDMQNMETKISFYDVFEKQELFDLWQCTNYRFYVCDGSSALNGGIMPDNAKPLLKNILEEADLAISGHGDVASFRFGHDGNIIPLLSLLGLQDCYASVAEPNDFYKSWSSFKVAPMAANVQLIFFRKAATEPILVKFMLNEKEILIPAISSNTLPYYNWKDVKAFYYRLIN